MALLRVFFIALLALSVLPNLASSAVIKARWFGNSFSVAGWQDVSLLRFVNGDTTGIPRSDSLVLTTYFTPSCWLDCHEKADALTKIDSGGYNYVIAQDNSAGWLYTASASQKSTYADRLTNWANHTKGAGGKLIIEQMWIAVGSTMPQAGQDLSDKYYDSVARATNSMLVPSGHAWWYAHKERPNMEWIAPDWADGVHPGSAGAYTNVCCYYAMITGRSPIGIKIHWIDAYLPDSGGLCHYNFSNDDALFLQTKAWEAVQFFKGVSVVNDHPAATAGMSIAAAGPLRAKYSAATRMVLVSGRNIRDLQVVGLDGAPVQSVRIGTNSVILNAKPASGLYLVKASCDGAWQTVTLRIGL
jgi:hypothetical protein